MRHGPRTVDPLPRSSVGPLLAGLVLAAGLGGAPATAAAQIADRAALVQALDSAARAHAEHPMVAGVSVAVVRGADTLLLKGYGLADLEWDVATPEDASASYEIGSVTKQFTAAAVLRLAEAGHVDLDADVTEYLPDFDTGGHVVPLRRLLDHTSGIPSYTARPWFGELRMQDLPRDTLVTLTEREPFDFEPGTALIYNNGAYFLAGLVIEAVSGQSYEEYLTEAFFEPLGMDDTYYCSESDVRARRAHGYDATPDGLDRKAYLDHTWPFAAGSLCSTAGDLIRWNRALHGGEVLSDASYREMVTPRPLLDGTPTGYAMGLGVSERGGRRVIAHGGGINGFLTDARFFPDEDLIVVVLQNSAAPQGPNALSGPMVEMLLGPLPEPEAVPYAGDLDALVGTYAGPVRGSHMHMVVTRDGEQLVFTPRGAEEGARPIHVGDGVWEDGGTRRWFERAGDRVLELRVDHGGGHYVLRRLPEGS